MTGQLLPSADRRKPHRTQLKCGAAFAIERWSPMMVFVLPKRGLEESMRPLSTSEKMKAALTDSHFLAPLIVFCIGLALLIVLH
jgi:hypothetical protein